MYSWPHLKIEIFQRRKQKMSQFVPEKVSFASIFSLQLSPMFSLVLYRNNLYQIHATFTMEDVNKQKTVLNKNKFYFKYYGLTLLLMYKLCLIHTNLLSNEVASLTKMNSIVSKVLFSKVSRAMSITIRNIFTKEYLGLTFVERKEKEAYAKAGKNVIKIKERIMKTYIQSKVSERMNFCFSCIWSTVTKIWSICAEWWKTTLLMLSSSKKIRKGSIRLASELAT